MSISPSAAIKTRLSWLDVSKGISILWIVFFHFFIAYAGERFPWPLKWTAVADFAAGCSSGSIGSFTICLLEGLTAAFFQRGSQPVGVFVVLSGFGLTYSLARYESPEGGWLTWYRRRLLRLLPMYWLAHLICLACLLLSLPLFKDPLDWRFALSFLGNRVVPAPVLFYYLVPAWWFFGLLVQLYLAFPFLYRIMRRLGPVRFLAACAFFTIFTRYLLQDMLQAHGNWSQGAFFGARLWEFAAGMVLAFYYRHHPGPAEEHFFSRRTLAAGIWLYILGTYSYQPMFTYTLTDAFVGIGLFIMTAHFSRRLEPLTRARSLLVYAGVYSYGLYLLHQPFVMFAGEHLRPYGMGIYVLSATLVVAGVTFITTVLEIWTNRFTEGLFTRLAAAGHPARLPKP
ncbi:MAG: acyltransferase [Deltaproteobacteria bacterium]|nr:acyltransferase [Deltaproteobacteria bacterium]